MDSEHLSQWAELLKAVGHPIRLMILTELLRNPKCVNAMQELIGARQARVSQHLAILKHCGLVAFSQRGTRRCYYLPRPELVRSILQVLKRDYPALGPERVRRAVDHALARRTRKISGKRDKRERRRGRHSRRS